MPTYDHYDLNLMIYIYILYEKQTDIRTFSFSIHLLVAGTRMSVVEQRYGRQVCLVQRERGLPSKPIETGTRVFVVDSVGGKWQVFSCRVKGRDFHEDSQQQRYNLSCSKWKTKWGKVTVGYDQAFVHLNFKEAYSFLLNMTNHPQEDPQKAYSYYYGSKGELVSYTVWSHLGEREVPRFVVIDERLLPSYFLSCYPTSEDDEGTA